MAENVKHLTPLTSAMLLATFSVSLVVTQVVSIWLLPMGLVVSMTVVIPIVVFSGGLIAGVVASLVSNLLLLRKGTRSRMLHVLGSTLFVAALAMGISFVTFPIIDSSNALWVPVGHHIFIICSLSTMTATLAAWTWRAPNGIVIVLDAVIAIALLILIPFAIPPFVDDLCLSGTLTCGP